MGLIQSKEAVWIDDGVWDINGVLVGWDDATDEVPPDKNFEAKYMIYKPPVDSNRSWIYKILGGVAKIAAKFGGKETAENFGFKVSPEPIPKPAINGYPNGKTVDGITKSDDAPDKRVVIEEDMYGNAPYAEKVWGKDRDQESLAQKENRIQELEQRLDAQRGKTEEMKQEVDREEKDNRGRNRHSDYWGEDVPEDEY